MTLIFQKLTKLPDHDTVLGQEFTRFGRLSDNLVDKNMYVTFYYGILVHSYKKILKELTLPRHSLLLLNKKHNRGISGVGIISVFEDTLYMYRLIF